MDFSAKLDFKNSRVIIIFNYFWRNHSLHIIQLFTKVVSPEKVATSAYVNPIIALILGWKFLNEELTTQSVVASIVLLTGVYFITSRKRISKNKVTTKPQSNHFNSIIITHPQRMTPPRCVFPEINKPTPGAFLKKINLISQ